VLFVIACAAVAAPAEAATGPRVIEVDAAIDVGDLADVELNDEVVAMAAVDSGYWFAAADGGVFAFGDAGFHGSMGGVALNAPIVGMASTASGEGYWLVGADGGVFAFGDAGFHGSMGGVALNAPIVGMASTASGEGYWLVGADGGVFAFGDAGFVGSIGDVGTTSPIVSVAPSPEGDGYALLDRNGTIWRFPNRTASATADEITPAVAVIWGADALDVVHADGTIVRREGSGPTPTAPPVTGRVVTAAATPAGGFRLAVVPDRITIAAGGDVHGESRVARVLAAGRNPLEPVVGAMTAADIGVVNLETAVGSSGRAAAKRYTFRAAPELVHRLADAGVDVVSLANNHALDYGVSALFETIEHARAAGLAIVGAGRNAAEAYAPALVETDGGTVAVVSLSQVLSPGWAATADRPGLASGHDRAASIAAVTEAAELADTVVVSIHWGRELDRCASAGQRDLARALVAAGADVILGHHPHVLQGIDRIDGAVVAYSLGNFVWYHSKIPSAETALLEVEVEAGRADTHRVVPAVIDAEGRPVPVGGERGARIAGATEAFRPGAGRCPA
jgi:poly-gamma-glutamate synthesis protein (capsule biosynthesis protein)